MTHEQIGVIAITVLGTGGLGAWLIKEAIRVRDIASRLPARIDEIEESCSVCREKVNARLDDGTDEFAKTRVDLLATSKDAALENAKMREELFQRFITEATFKDRVVATMMAACPNCRRGDSNK